MRKSKIGKGARAFNSPLKVKEALAIATKSASNLSSEAKENSTEVSSGGRDELLKQISELEDKIKANNEQG